MRDSGGHAQPRAARVDTTAMNGLLTDGETFGPDVIVVEDNDASRGIVVRFLRQHLRRASVIGVGSIAAAREVLWDGVRGMVVDVQLPDGDGLQVLDALRGVAPRARSLLVTGRGDAWIANRAAEREALLARKPDLAGPLRAFAQNLAATSAARATGGTGRLCGAISEVAIDVLATSAALTPQGRRIVDLMSRGVAREALAEALDVAETTLRSHVREVLARTGVARTDALGWRLLRICDELVAAGYGVDHADEDEGAPWGRGAGPSSHPQG
jgi:DNA-binding NarL/FixJ family response regulator